MSASPEWCRCYRCDGGAFRSFPRYHRSVSRVDFFLRSLDEEYLLDTKQVRVHCMHVYVEFHAFSLTPAWRSRVRTDQQHQGLTVHRDCLADKVTP